MHRAPEAGYRRPPLSGVIALVVFVACGCGAGDDGSPSARPFIAVFSAFPAELAALVEQAEIDETMHAGDMVARLGMLGGTRVVLAMTGIGLVNAETRSRAVLDRFAVTGVVVSGVAGSYLRIGDVAVPERWTFLDGTDYTTDPSWLAGAGRIATNDNVALQRCTIPPSNTTGEVVCLSHQPGIFVGGLGFSSDPFGGNPLGCLEEPGNYPDVFGCDIVSDSAVASNELFQNPFTGPKTSAAEPLASEDMETTAIAREAAVRGLPFIAFRAVSDGEGDPLNLPGFPAQFFAYYRLAADNAAAAAAAFLETLAKR